MKMKMNRREKSIKLFVSKIGETVNFADFMEEVVNYKPMVVVRNLISGFTGYTEYTGYTGFNENPICYTGYTGPSV